MLLKKQLEQVTNDLKQLTNDAQTKWADFEKSQKDFSDAPAEAQNSVDSDEYKAMEAASRAYGEVKDAISAKTNLQQGLIAQLAMTAPAAVEEDAPEGKSAAVPAALVKTAADAILNSAEYKSLAASPALKSSSGRLGHVALGSVGTAAEVKATVTGASNTSAGAFILPQQTGYVPMDRRELSLLDLITVSETNSDSVEWVRQTVQADQAAIVAEGGQKPEATIGYERVATPVDVVAAWIPATRQALADAPQVRSLIESDLAADIREKLEGKVFAAIAAATGTLSQSVAADGSLAEGIFGAIMQLRVGGKTAQAVLINPADWQTIRLAREGDGSGQYLYGGPAAAGVETIWGVPVVLSSEVAVGAPLVGDFRRAVTQYLREGLTFLASDSHLDFFTKNMVAILAETRTAEAVRVPGAIVEVTTAA